MSNSSTPSAVGLEVPDFSLPATAGKTFTLSAQRGNPLVIYFYPKDSTPGCTTEAQQFRDLHGEFVKAGGSVWGVSRDSIKSHENFKSILGLPFELLSDAEETACILFDVIKLKNMYGKLVKGIERSTFLIDRNGKLAREWRAVKADGHAAEVLTALQAL
ncbi:MAG: peroxiredoxin [Rhodocyclaceae bacterium]|jgi:peroxiredoxin Q/BCP|nr:peroxiredoxin [Rhodocyclaceae bacterium]